MRDKKSTGHYNRSHLVDGLKIGIRAMLQVTGDIVTVKGKDEWEATLAHDAEDVFNPVTMVDMDEVDVPVAGEEAKRGCDDSRTQGTRPDNPIQRYEAVNVVERETLPILNFIGCDDKGRPFQMADEIVNEAFGGGKPVGNKMEDGALRGAAAFHHGPGVMATLAFISS
jgi:hypothetical protein